jgi:hypothetical protein
MRSFMYADKRLALKLQKIETTTPK